MASELGILSKSRPVLITTFKQVPPGTNGAMSVAGTIASVFGGLIMGLTVGLGLMLETKACSSWSMVASTVAWGGFAGGFGSLVRRSVNNMLKYSADVDVSQVDSFLGATIQQTKYSTDSKKIIENAPKNSADIRVISGVDLLTNNQVNVVSSVVTALVVGLMTS